MLSSAAGNDLLFDESLCNQGKNFANKIWNAFRLINGWEIDEMGVISKSNEEAIEWYDSHFNKILKWVNKNFDKYRISDSLMSVYKLIWDDFCSWFLEIVKPSYGSTIDRESYNKILLFFENNLRLLHPFMPFLSEELWHFISNRNIENSLTISSWPKVRKIDEQIIEKFSLTREIIVAIRNFRKEKKLSFKEKLIYMLLKEIQNLSSKQP